MIHATITKNPFILALQSKKILDYENKSDVLKEFSDIISKTFFEAGQKTEADNLKLLCHGLYEEVKKYFPFMRMEEILIAFSNGVRKEYGEFFGINISTFNFWLKSWQTDEKRKQAQSAIRAANEVEYKPVMTRKQADIAWRETIINQFNEFKHTKLLTITMPMSLFKNFENMGLIKLSKEEKQAIYQQATEKFLKRLKIERLTPKSKLHLKELSGTIKRIEDKNPTSDDQTEIKSAACEIAIRNFYESIEKLEI